MKYLEELSPGEKIFYDESYYILTTDFRKNGSRLCIEISTGLPKWLPSNSIVENIQIYRLDKDNNIIAL